MLASLVLRLDISRNELRAATDRFRWAIERGREFSRSSQQFFDWLVRPALSEIGARGTENLVFVLDGALRQLPMAALHDGEAYLIERFGVARAPGLELLLPQTSTPPATRRSLIGGLSLARQGFNPLPQVETELGSIQDSIARSEVLLNQSFTEGEFQNSLQRRPFNIIHLATHGQFGSTADRTFILTWDERLDVKELGSLLQRHQRRSQGPIDLLVLSACETARGDDDAALGIAGMAVRSGAQSTIASLWALDDRAAAQFTTEFYRAYARGNTTKVEAFRQAQLSLLQRHRSAQYWAPFILLGSWL